MGAPLATRPNSIALAWRFALRELRGGFGGFFIFLACIALGVGAIAGVNSVARSITHAISSEGQNILGGDISFGVVQRDITPEALDHIKARGEVSRILAMRAMARTQKGDDQSLIELKAIDSAYPLYGELTAPDKTLVASQLGDGEAWVDQILLDRLDLKIGDAIRIGKSEFEVSNTIASEPDRIGEGVGFGPKVLISPSAMDGTGLVQPGSLVRYRYNLKVPGMSSAALKTFIAQSRSEFSQIGWRIRSRENAAPALTRNIERFSQFLTLVGLTALIVGGVGVANAIRAYLDTKRSVIATFKSLGAPGRLVFFTYLFQIMVLALLGVIAGLVLGVVAPYVAAIALEGLVPVSRDALFYPDALGLGAIYGLLTAFTFAVWPLAVSREIPAAALFRATGFTSQRWPALPYIIAMLAGVGSLVGLAVLLSDNRQISMIFVGAIGFAFVFLRMVSWTIQWIARKMPRVRSTELRMAIANIHRPGALTPSVVMSLGLGLALLVALAQIDGNMRQQVSGNIPDQAPDFFFVDVQNTEVDAFKGLLSEVAGPSKIISVPMLRGRITTLKGIAAEDYVVKDGQGAWVLRGDRGVTYAHNVPENSTLSKGEWWEKDYDGPPLVSFSAEEAGELDLDVGDKINVNVLGRTIEATIASLREVQWESLGINFVLVFSPNTFAGAPHSYLSTLKTEGTAATPAEGTILRAVAQKFPGVTSVAVSEVLDTVNNLISQLATAIRAAASVALIASIFVLGGALAAGNRSRVHDAVVLKTLGARRWTIVKAFVYEYALLGLSTGIFALLAGGVASWFVIDQIMGFENTFLPQVAFMTLAIALVFTIAFGLIGTWRILGQKAAPVLREL